VNKVSAPLLSFLVPAAISVVLLLSPAAPNVRAQQPAANATVHPLTLPPWRLGIAGRSHPESSLRSSPIPTQSQQPAATPTVHAHILLPVNPPVGWAAKGWADFRQRCQEIANKSQSNIPLTREQFETADVCQDFVPPPATETHEPTYPQRRLNSSPMPTAAPTPQALRTNSTPGGDPPAGPFGTQFNALGGDACTAQPLDVAADVSSTQIVELLNSGIWISDKNGNVASGYPYPLATFWAPESIPNGNFLTDTQIAYDPFASRWIATTLSVPQAKDNGDLYIGISATSIRSLQRINGLAGSGTVRPGGPRIRLSRWTTIWTSLLRSQPSSSLQEQDTSWQSTQPPDVA
jgi:hypothetical protein